MSELKLLLGAALVVLAVAGCGGASSSSAGTSAAGSCSAALDWNGTRYYGRAAKSTVSAPGPDLRPAAIRPPCNDTNFSHDRPRRAAVRAVSGVDPALGIVSADRVLVAPGTFPARPGHPLHRVLYGSAAQPRRAGDHRRCRVGGVVTEVSVEGFGVRVAGGRETAVTVDAGTRIAGARVLAGQPSLRRGDVVDARARRCVPGGLRVTAVKVSARPG